VLAYEAALPAGKLVALSTENACWASNCCVRTEHPGRHINAGVCLGRGAILAPWYDRVKLVEDEQLGFCEAQAEWPEAVLQDHEHRLCLNLTPNWKQRESSMSFMGMASYFFAPETILQGLGIGDDGKLQVLESGVKPIAVHLPGSKLDLFYRYNAVGRQLLPADFRSPLRISEVLEVWPLLRWGLLFLLGLVMLHLVR
jgi:hypothetical protein